MIIRKCNETDINNTALLYDNEIIYLDNHINYPKWKYKIYPSIESVSYNTKNGFQYICIDNDEIIATFVLNDDPEGAYDLASWSKDLKQGEFMVIHGLLVSNKYYGLGIGTKIVNYCINKAKELGYLGLRLDIVPTNIPAKNLYLKNGFKYVSDIDLKRNVEDIDKFSLFELYF